MIALHLVAHTLHGSPSLCERPVAPWLWSRLRRAFRGAIAVVLMPDHVHLLTNAHDPTRAREDLARTLGNVRRASLGAYAPRWAPVPPAGVVTDTDKLLRQIRYIALNPVRARLVSDPLAWLWSTHRDVMGAVLDPWVHEAQLATLLGRRERGFRDFLHRYVSSDPSCSLTGTPGVRLASRAELEDAPLSRLVGAALACTRADTGALSRRGLARSVFLCLAEHAGTFRPAQIAAVCRMSTSGVHARRGHAPAGALDAALICLNDTRLVPTGQILHFDPASGGGSALEVEDRSTSPQAYLKP